MTPNEAVRVATALGGGTWVVKAQIHAGDRAQAGAVQTAHSLEAVREAAARLLGKRLVTGQTGPRGMPVTRVYIEQACDIARELYLGMLVDVATARVTLLASRVGGAGVEALASESPERVSRVAIDPELGLGIEAARAVARELELEGELGEAAAALMIGLYRAFVELDASLIDVNPLVVTGDGRLLALDAKMSLDDNALFRHTHLAALRDESEEDPDRLERERHGFNYVRLEGDIGCVVTGAGLALATMDLIKLAGGAPANFLDLPPVATRVQIAAAVKRVLANPSVRALLVNAFGGGIARCDEVAEGVVTAAREAGMRVPVVVRFAGTNREVGLMLLANSSVPIVTARSFGDAVDKVLAAAAGRSG